MFSEVLLNGQEGAKQIYHYRANTAGLLSTIYEYDTMCLLYQIGQDRFDSSIKREDNAVLHGSVAMF